MGSRIAFAAIVLPYLFTRALIAEEPLKNSDVIALIRAGLGDEIVIAKIEQSPRHELDVSTDALIQLKKSGLSKAVLDAMLRRASGATARLAAVPPRESKSSGKGTRPKSDVRLCTKAGDFDMTSLRGETSGTFAWVTTLFWLNYPGLHAKTRVADLEPTILIWSEEDPQSRYYLVKLDSNQDDGDRSVKMGRTRAFSATAPTSPDKTWTFPYQSTEERPGLWRIRLQAPLKPGEYGLWTQPAEMYDFGIDP